MKNLELIDVEKSYPNPESKGYFKVLDRVNLSVAGGSFTSIMGPSGCGKTTLLNILAGITTMDSGELLLDGQQLTPGDFSFSYVFQKPRLLNWRTVRQNLEFALKAHDVPKNEWEERVDYWLKRVDLDGEAENYPLRLSGGMQQRVGLARALVVDPEILLMDEPFSALDEVTSRKLQEDLMKLWNEQQKTILFVTHDVREAVFLSKNIIFMNNQGEIFNRVEVNADYPREFEDPDLLEIEAQISKDFFREIES